MSQAMQELLSILDLERIEHNLYRGSNPKVGWQRVFGGQVIGQALVAAQRTVGVERNVHSLHCYFMLPGDPSIPIVYNVDRLRDGGSFTTRRVTAIQNGRAIFSLECSFQIEEEGLEHQLPMPLDVPPPEALRSQFQLLQEAGHAVPEAIRNFWARERPLEIKPINVEHYTSREKLPPYQSVWIRTSGAVPDERPLQRAILAYLSDMTLLDASTFPHGRTGFDPDGQPRPRHVVPSRPQARRLAALHPGHPQHDRRARLLARVPLCPRRHVDRLDRAGGAGAAAASAHEIVICRGLPVF
jgi:acyl-CoA thioesterase-2